MDQPNSARQGRPGDDASRSSGDGELDPLKDFVLHAKSAVGAGRSYLAIMADEAVGKIARWFVGAILTIFVLSLAFVLACSGLYHLIVGSIAGLALALGNQWSACLIVGFSSVVCAAAMIAIPLRHFSKARMKRLREKYDQAQATSL
jgi:hypothetical protein